jgi:hypothetical protein
MRKVLYSFTALLIIFAILPSCSDDNITASKKRTLGLKDFPNEIGNGWSYLVTDTINGESRTLGVYISDSVTIYGGSKGLTWLYIDSEWVYYTDFIFTFDDSIWFFRETVGYPYRMLDFPLEIGKNWSYNVQGGIDVCSVLTVEKVNVTAGEFDAFRVETGVNFLALDPIYFSKLWIVPGVGIVKMEIATGFRIIESYEIWELISYNVTN